MSAIELTITSPDGETRELRLPGPQARLGRGADCDVALNGWRVAKQHALLRVDERGRLVIEDLGGVSGTQVNGERVTRHGPLAFADAIVIGGHRLRARLAELAQAPVELLHSGDMRQGGADAVAAVPSTALVTDAAAAQRFAWRKRVHDRLLETIDLRRRDFSRLSDQELRVETRQLAEEIVTDLAAQLPPGLDSGRLVQEVLDEAVGLGPLEALLADEGVTEIMVNRHDQIFVERAGRLQPHPLAFTSDRAVLGVIERIVSPLGRRIDEASPMVDARLKDGSRVNAVIPPLAIKGPALTIRKFSQRRLSGEDLVAFGSLSPAMVEFLDLCVRERKNIVVSGGTGSGKTTFLNVLSNVIPDGERIVTSKTLPNCACTTAISCRWRRALPTLKAAARSPSATS
jgi:pilus assembly protein CpaF